MSDPVRLRRAPLLDLAIFVNKYGTKLNRDNHKTSQTEKEKYVE